jgi:hypothetical protein
LLSCFEVNMDDLNIFLLTNKWHSMEFCSSYWSFYCNNSKFYLICSLCSNYSLSRVNSFSIYCSDILRGRLNTGHLDVVISVKWHIYLLQSTINSLTPKLNLSAQRCLTRFFTRDFVSWTVNFVNICVKNQQMQQLLFHFINYVW